VRVGWVKGENRLYFLCTRRPRANWDSPLPTLHNDIFEVVVDAERGGGPFIGEQQDEAAVRDPKSCIMNFQAFAGAELSHLHAGRGEGTGAWSGGSASSGLKEMPWSNSACNYNFTAGRKRQADAGVLDHPVCLRQPPDGPTHSVESKADGK